MGPRPARKRAAHRRVIRRIARILVTHSFEVTPVLSIVLLSAESWAALATLFSSAGHARWCWLMRLRPASAPARRRTDQDHPATVSSRPRESSD